MTAIQDPRIAAALAIHAPECRCCGAPSVAECTCSAEWIPEEDRKPAKPVCPVCVANWACEETEPWPCPTVQALTTTPTPEETK